ncbi:flagellar type III secretion system protein FliR, partial [archaeon]
QLGFAIANVLDPTSSEQVSIIAQFEQFLAFLIFLVINGHYMLVAALYKSFQVVPLGRFIFSGVVAKELISASAQVFAVGLKLAAPVVVTLTVTNIAMAVISKTMPQINVYFLGFPVQIGLGFIVMGVSLPVFYWVFKSAIDGMMKGIFAIITLVGGV